MATSGALALLLLPAAASAQAGPPEAKRCRDAANAPKGMTCATLPVALDHSGATVGRVGLNLARVPATGPRKGTLAILTGGPGEPAVPAAGPVSQRLRGVRRSHDLLFVDQRGSGGSDAVECRSVATPAGVRRCAEALGPRRPFWTTKETALDLEDVRAAVGVEKLSLLGISYGAKVAGEYARRFPARTERIVLDSPAPVDGIDTSLVLRQLGLPRILDEVCYPGCRAFLRAPDAALSALVRRLERRPLSGRAVLPSGRTRPAPFTADDLYGLVILSDLDPQLRTALPAAIASGVLGDAQPLLRLAGTAGGSVEMPETAVNAGRLLATGCLEGRLPWAPDAPVAGREQALVAAFNAAPAATFAPFGRARVAKVSIAARCAAWPSTRRPETVPLLGPDVPVLVLGGREDLRTPLEDARRTASQYPNATVLGVPGVGHSVLASDASRCATTGVTAFLTGGTVAKCTKRVELPVAPFVPASLDDLRPARGVPGAAGRVATATQLTLLDFSRRLLAGPPELGVLRVPGLRGGTASLRFRAGPGRAAITMRDYELVRGVRLSGTLGERTGRLTVAAPGGIAGTLTTGRDDRVRGVIDGRRVSFLVE